MPRGRPRRTEEELARRRKLVTSHWITLPRKVSDVIAEAAVQDMIPMSIKIRQIIISYMNQKKGEENNAVL
jgi:hypothetical protein